LIHGLDRLNKHPARWVKTPRQTGRVEHLSLGRAPARVHRTGLQGGSMPAAGTDANGVIVLS
jgi:hypothetical protein